MYKILDVSGKMLPAVFQMEYKGYIISATTIYHPEVAVFESEEASKAMETFYGDTAICDAMAFINRGCTKLEIAA